MAQIKRLRLGEIAGALGGRLNRADCSGREISGVCIDTRYITGGELFIPLKGNTDGHAFIGSAFEKGAACALSERDVMPDKPVIRVDSTSGAMLRLAEYCAARFKIPKIAITGSSGKTTTKDMTADVLSQRYNTLRTIGNHNNEIGVPLTVFALDAGHECAVFEMGMNHSGELERLSRVVRPDICVITNIGVAHIENFGSREGILRAKLEMLEHMRPGGTTILNGSDDMLSTVIGSVENPMLYWIENEAPRIPDTAGGVYATDVTDNGMDGVSCAIHYGGSAFRVNLRTPGRHMIFNALAAAAVGFCMGLTAEQIKSGIEGYVPGDARMNTLKAQNGITIIDDSYNANPISMKSALDVLSKAPGRRICVLGDMLELGSYSDEMHFCIGQYAAAKGLDTAIFIGEKSEYAYDAYVAARPEGNALHFARRESLYDCLGKVVKAGDVVLVKASHGMRFSEVVEKIKQI